MRLQRNAKGIVKTSVRRFGCSGGRWCSTLFNVGHGRVDVYTSINTRPVDRHSYDQSGHAYKPSGGSTGYSLTDCAFDGRSLGGKQAQVAPTDAEPFDGCPLPDLDGRQPFDGSLLPDLHAIEPLDGYPPPDLDRG